MAWSRLVRTTSLAGLGGAAALLTVELVLQLLPVSSASKTGYHIDPLILTYPAHHRFTMATGWDLRNAQTLQANNLGFISPVDFKPNPDAVALIGDSYVESSMLPASQRLDAQLQALLGPSRPVYAMGSPGTSLLDYAERVRLASQQLQVRDVVLFITKGDVRQSQCGSGNVNGPCVQPGTLAPATELQPAPTWPATWLRHSALAQYVFGQLKVRPAQVLPALKALPATLLPGQPGGTRQPARPPVHTDSEATLRTISLRFFDRVRPLLRGRLVLVIDRPMPERPDPDVAFEMDVLTAVAREQGATVVDMGQAYRAHAAASRLSLYVSPTDQHLNPMGLALVARSAAAGLQASPDADKPLPAAAAASAAGR